MNDPTRTNVDRPCRRLRLWLIVFVAALFPLTAFATFGVVAYGSLRPDALPTPV